MRPLLFEGVRLPPAGPNNCSATGQLFALADTGGRDEMEVDIENHR